MANPRLCSIPGCGKIHRARGWCPAHYYRFSMHGDPLGGAPARDGAPMRFIHEVALQHTGEECLIWPFGRNGDGYGSVQVDGKMVNAHRYLCQIAHGEPPTATHQAAHSCGKGHLGCVAKNHLRWATPAENQADRLIHGTRSIRRRIYAERT